MLRSEGMIKRKPMIPKILCAALLVNGAVFGQAESSAEWAVHLINKFNVTPNITYLTANNYEAKLDVYAPARCHYAAAHADLDSWRRVDGRRERAGVAAVRALAGDGFGRW